ncbi:Flagellar hook-basal body complex protein FliE [Arthrobacter saudimassiliensis]|uniref:Flagellar hook-basal body complex protein FliE n=1 Tax=Arthrobacter saudimassiliensis TaxID=1461584 RepID=A0A078MK58_9MICC|nr:Flagellar hook-basal body complex protein FliE [Arthrobacter saudimassiliensis]
MPVPALPAVSGVMPTGYLQDTSAPAPVTDGSAFAASLTGAVDNLSQLQTDSKALAVQAVTGDLDDIHNASIASARTQMTLELVAAVRNKGVEAFNEIMRMQA